MATSGFLKSFVSGPIIVLLSACVPTTGYYLYKDGGTVSRADTDYFDCELASARSVPTDTQIGTTPVYTTPVQTNCYNTGYSVQCNSTGGDVYGGETYSYDANADLRADFWARCMVSKGYQVTELPNCDTSKVQPAVLEKLGGKLRRPQPGSCYVQVTKNTGNIVYPTEVLK